MQTETQKRYEKHGIEIKYSRDGVKVSYADSGTGRETVMQLLSSEVNNYKSIIAIPSGERVKVEGTEFSAVRRALDDSLDDNWEDTYDLESENN